MTAVATLTVNKAAKAGSLADIKTQPHLQLFGNRCYDKAILAIDGTNAENIQTTAAVDYSIGGVMYTKAAVAEIDVSGLAFIDQEGTVITNPALATGYDKAYLLVLDTAGTIFVVAGNAVATGGTCVPPHCPPAYCPFAAVKVANATGSDFTFGTTDLDTSGITDTYFDLAIVPPSL